MTAKEQLKSVREEYAPLRKRIRVLLIVWLVLRAVVLVIEFRLTSLDFIESSDIADSIVAFIFAIFFAFYIDYGYSTVATLPLIGGVYTVINAVRTISAISGTYFVPSIVRIYVWAALILGILQTLLMLDFLFGKRYAPYYKRIAEISKAIRESKKQAKKGTVPAAPEDLRPAAAPTDAEKESREASAETEPEATYDAIASKDNPAPDSSEAEATTLGEFKKSKERKSSGDNPFEI